MRRKIATGRHKHFPTMIMGEFKFEDDTYSNGVSRKDLIATAKALVNINPGNGIYEHVAVRSTGKGELGICLTYTLGVEESQESNLGTILLPYVDFMMKQHGRAFRGRCIEMSVDVIELE